MPDIAEKVLDEDSLKLNHRIKKLAEEGKFEEITTIISNRVTDEQERNLKSAAEKIVDKLIEKLPEPPKPQVDYTNTEPTQTKDNAGFKGYGEYLKAVWNAGDNSNPIFDPRLKALAEGTGADGGYTVPTQFISMMEKSLIESSIFRRAGALVVPCTGNSIELPMIKDEDHDTNLFGGIVCHWGSEAAAMTESSMKIDQVLMRLEKLYAMTYVSSELMEDNAVGLEAILRQKTGQAIAWYEDKAFVQGTGVGRPLGVVNSGALISITRSGASAFALQDSATMLASLASTCYSNSVWLANPVILKLLIQQTATNAIWISPDQGATKTPPAMILGRPLYFTEHCSALNTAGDVLLIDPTWYLVTEKTGMRAERSREFRFNYDQDTFRFIKRVDGRPLIDDYLELRDGSTTVSPFVAAAAGSG